MNRPNQPYQAASNKTPDKRRRHRQRKSESEKEFHGSANVVNAWPSTDHCVVQFIHPKSYALNFSTAARNFGTVKNSVAFPYGNRHITKIEMQNSAEAQSLWRKYTTEPLSGVVASPDNIKKLKNNRKPYFEDHLPHSELEAGITTGELIKGTLRVNAKKFSHAFIADKEGHDILMDGFKDRNRALNGDVVAVRIKDKKDWIIGVSDLAEQLGAVSVGDSKADQASPNVSSPTVGKFNKTRKTGVVVGIVEKKSRQVVTGHLRLDKAKPNDKFITLETVSKNNQNLQIPREEVMKEKAKQDISNVLELCQSIGEIGQIEPETTRILIDHEVDFSEFSDAVNQCLPSDLPWTIPQAERAKRRDFTSECIFSIDPPSARDLDDALHCKQLPNGTYEIGVHIADVSYFVHPGIALDKILSQWFGRSVIRSCAKFSYDHAQSFIDNPDRDFSQPESACQENEFPEITGNFSMNEIKTKVLGLFKVSQNLRKQRIDNGALRLDQVRLSYTLNSETGLPNGCYTYEYKKSNELIEEFMLLANMAVAHKLYTSIPTHAFLRSHSEPKEEMMQDFVSTCMALGLEVDASSSEALAICKPEFEFFRTSSTTHIVVWSMYSRFGRCLLKSQNMNRPNQPYQAASNKTPDKRRRHRQRKSESEKEFHGSANVVNAWPSTDHCVVQFIHPKSYALNFSTAARNFGTVKNSVAFPYGNRHITKIEMQNSAEAQSLWRKYTTEPLSGVVASPDTNKKLKNNWKPYFEDHLPHSELEAGIATGELIKGTLRVNAKKFSHAFIADKEGHDILMDGFKDRNRALNGDVVAVRIKDKKDWIIGVSDLAEQLGAVSVGDSKADQTSPNVSSPTVGKFNKTRKTGVVVGIVEKKSRQVVTGHLRLDKAKPNDKFITLETVSKNNQNLQIPREEVMKEKAKQDISNVLFVGKILKWEPHSPLPLGELCQSIGEIGQIEPETTRILIDHEVDFSEFSNAVNQCLPSDLPWTIPQAERAKRRDFTSECIFSIDPPSARDLDDALHCKQLPNGTYEIGVHIADVSYFVHPGTALDKVASERCTSVYLVQRVIPMLPRLLCEELCSLNPGTERLAFSVVWNITEQGKILSQWFGRSVIRSCAKFSYDHAQSFIDNPDRDFSQPESACQENEFPEITGNFSMNEIKTKVLGLFKVSQNLRKQRIDNGALRLDQVRLSYTLNSETGLPNGCYTYEYKKSNELIEEFMLLANMAVAHKLYTSIPTHAFLRSHSEPKEEMMQDFVSTCMALGLEVDASSSEALAESLRTAPGADELAKYRKQALFLLAIKPQQLATYICAGSVSDESKYHHYALNVPLYTHFTSPIRRYADLVVHRQLAAVIGEQSDEQMMNLSTDELQAQATLCNHRKSNAKQAQELSIDLFFNLLVNNFGPLESRGMVMNVLDRAVDILSTEYGVTKRVYLEELPLISHKCEEKLVPGSNVRIYTQKLKWPLEGHDVPEPQHGSKPVEFDASTPGIVQTLETFSVVDFILEKKEPVSATSIRATLKRLTTQEDTKVESKI
uniref:DIS3-like exonuclease 2 n=1 Tax=Ciona intestinalis TaxID=7719 RepID=UPI000EF48948|nr:DIS3-like exonuclease 2 [Ciona intestinalis]|eukprot:XP_026694724.1 DIS3-like exonuclease 2 [Ciona intestinalis]